MTRSSRSTPLRLRVRNWIQTVADRLPFIGDHQDTNEQVSPSLYVCPSCDITYIATDLSSCHECGGTVAHTPTASELGFGSAGSE